MAFVHLLRYLIRPHPSTTHRSGELFINTAIMQLATYEIDITIEQPSFSQKVGQCSNGEVHNGLKARSHRHRETRNEKRETRNEKRETRNEKRETRNEKRETRNEKRETAQ